jgi:hypothetical protein
MANIRKSFNFRNGVQVDDDNFIVNANGLVGIGTSIPTEFLDVHGTAKVTGLVTATNLAITGVSTFYSDVKIGSGISMYASTGIISATAFYGSAVGLTSIYAIAVDGWYVNAGNLSTTSKVGIGTDFPNYSLQVGQDPLTGNGLSIDEITGNVNTTGIITASSLDGLGTNITNLNASNIASGTLNNARLPQNISVSGIVTAYSFSGFGTNLQGLNATNITNGTLDNSILPQNISITGIITASNGVITSLTNTNLNNTGIATLGVANASRLLVSGVTTSTGGFVGNVTGTATTATSISGSPNITVSNITSSNINNTGIITSSSIISQLSSIGVSTVSTRLYAESIGVGTNSPSGDIHIRRISTSTLQVTSDTAEAIVAVGRSTTLTGNNGALRFGNTSGVYPYSNSRTLDLINYGTGNLNHYLNYSAGSGNIGDFNWIYAPDATNPLMTLTYQGNLGLGVTNPAVKLQVSGIASVSSLVSQDLTVTQDIIATGAGTSTSVETLYVYGGKSQILNSDGTEIFSGSDENVNLTTGISTFFDINVTSKIIGGYIGIGTTNPIFPIQIGNYIGDIKNSVVISQNGIGLGTDFTDGAFFLDAGTKKACFGLVSVGTTEDIIDVDTSTTVCYVEGNSEFNGNVGIGTTLATSKLHVVGGARISGVTTSQNGFTSGIGVTNPVQITVSGSILTFTVAGVGSTSLTLF